MAKENEVRITSVQVVATIPINFLDEDDELCPYDGTVEDFYKRAPKNLQEIVKKHLGNGYHASYWNGALRILSYTVG